MLLFFFIIVIDVIIIISCNKDWNNFQTCMEAKNDLGGCQFYYDVLKQCQEKNPRV